MWNASSSPGWNAAEVGPKRDVLQELYDAAGANISLAPEAGVVVTNPGGVPASANQNVSALLDEYTSTKWTDTAFGANGASVLQFNLGAKAQVAAYEFFTGLQFDGKTPTWSRDATIAHPIWSFPLMTSVQQARGRRDAPSPNGHHGCAFALAAGRRALPSVGCRTSGPPRHRCTPSPDAS